MDLVAEEEPRSGAEVAAQMAASGVLDEIFSKIDAGELDLTGTRASSPGWSRLRSSVASRPS